MLATIDLVAKKLSCNSHSAPHTAATRTRLGSVWECALCPRPARYARAELAYTGLIIGSRIADVIVNRRSVVVFEGSNMGEGRNAKATADADGM